MKNAQAILEKVQKGETAKAHDLPPEAVAGVISEYQQEIIDSLILNGYVQITNEIRIEIVPIRHRKYVLKGQEYRSNRIYKLKAGMGDKIYNRIAERYNQFREDLEEVDL